MSGMFDKIFQGKTPVVIGAVLVLGCAVVLAVVVGGCRTGSSGGGADSVHYICEACGHEWDDPPTATPKCPKCGEVPIMRAWYECPRCKKPFSGVESKKLGPGKMRYRASGTEKWMRIPPKKLTCPHCKFSSSATYKRPTTPEGKPLPTGDDRPRRR